MLWEASVPISIPTPDVKPLVFALTIGQGSVQVLGRLKYHPACRSHPQHGTLQAPDGAAYDNQPLANLPNLPVLALKLKPLLEAQAKAREHARKTGATTRENFPTSSEPGRVNEGVAKDAKVSYKNVEHAEKIINNGAPEVVRLEAQAKAKEHARKTGATTLSNPINSSREPVNTQAIPDHCTPQVHG